MAKRSYIETIMGNKIEIFINRNFLGISLEEVRKYFSNESVTDLESYLNNPSNYQNLKNKKHTGTFLGTENKFTSKFTSIKKLEEGVKEAVEKGTFGFDNNGKPCVWLDKENQDGELRKYPLDFGTDCHAVKVVNMWQKDPKTLEPKIHGYPIETTEGYNMLFLIENCNELQINKNNTTHYTE